MQPLVQTSTHDQGRRATAADVFTFTPRGEQALDELAEAMAAQCSHTPDGIAHLLDQVLHTDIDELAQALSTTAAANPEQTAAG